MITKLFSDFAKLPLVKNYHFSLFRTTEIWWQNSSFSWFWNEKCEIDPLPSSGPWPSRAAAGVPPGKVCPAHLHNSWLGFCWLGQDGTCRVASSAPWIQSLAFHGQTSWSPADQAGTKVGPTYFLKNIGCPPKFEFQICSVSQFCLTLCDPVDCSPPDSSVHGIFPGKYTGTDASSYSRGSSWARGQTHVSCISCIGRWILHHCTTWEALNFR